MMRIKFNLNLKQKVLLAILLPVIVVLVALWLLQVVFLEDYYMSKKQKDIINTTINVGNLVREKGQLSSQDDIYQIALEDTLCIDVTAMSDYTSVVFEGLGDNCLMHTSSINKNKMILNILQSDKEYVFSDIKHPRFDTRYFACGTQLIAANGQKYIVIVVATLAPVKEAAYVIKNQLLYLTIALLIITLIIALFIAKSLTRPILKVSSAAKRVAQGDLNINVDINTEDEIGELSRNFNYMTNEIKKVNTLQRELVANLSHDIRTPLTMIKGYAEAIKDITGDNKPKREQQLDVIVEETDRLNSLVSDVMNLSLMQAGQTKFNYAKVNISQKASDVISRFDLMANKYDITIAQEGDSDVFVYADDIKIEQVLYNLINNAINHIGDGKNITIRISKLNLVAKIEVIDTGVGISQDDLPLIWDRYYKPYKNTERKAMGTGLGLSIVKAILINHTTNFGVISTLGHGSSFWFELKLFEESSEE